MSFSKVLPKMEFGAVYSHVLRYWTLDANENRVPVDLTGYDAAMEIEVQGSIKARLTVANGGLILSGNTITIYMNATLTKPLSFDEADYDILLMPGGDHSLARRFAYGTISGEPVFTDL